ncbi:MAG: hypothetical protein EGQ91_03525 [Clostridiales bacterium]|nr:hypothetical protein [Clostridiales bacterium]
MICLFEKIYSEHRFEMPKFFPIAANQIRRSFCFVRKYLFFKNKFAKIDKKLLTNDNFCI